MKNRKKLNNKGFSLVELIVVIAIMVILVVVIAPTLISKIEDSRESTDLQAIGEIREAVTTALANEKVYKELVDSTKDYVSYKYDLTNCTVGKTETDKELQEILEAITFKSNALDGADVYIFVSSAGKVYVEATSKGASGSASDGVGENAIVSGDTVFAVGTFPTTTTP